jgi:ribosomal protein L11 methyltransferase
VRYLEVSIRCQRAACDAVGNLLAELTGGGYSVDDPLDIIQNRSKWEITDLVPGDPAWVTVSGWLAEANDVETAQAQLAVRLDEIRALGLGAIEAPTFKWVQEEDWANAWKAYFKPTKVGERLVVIPSWETYELKSGDLPLYLDPGMAFGTGTHPTTALCLRALERAIKPGAKVLDVGTGSGILAIAAARLGAAQVDAIDIDGVAVEVAKENAAKNGVAIDARVGEIAAVEERDYDLVIANIIASIIIEILPEAASRMKPGGHFLCSGIISEKKEQVLQAITEVWLLPKEIKEEAGWVSILAVKV